jgi:hypothetical protein
MRTTSGSDRLSLEWTVGLHSIKPIIVRRMTRNQAVLARFVVHGLIAIETTNGWSGRSRKSILIIVPGEGREIELHEA